MVCGLEGGSHFQTVAIESMTFELRLKRSQESNWMVEEFPKTLM